MDHVMLRDAAMLKGHVMRSYIMLSGHAIHSGKWRSYVMFRVYGIWREGVMWTEIKIENLQVCHACKHIQVTVACDQVTHHQSTCHSTCRNGLAGKAGVCSTCHTSLGLEQQTTSLNIIHYWMSFAVNNTVFTLPIYWNYHIDILITQHSRISCYNNYNFLKTQKLMLKFSCLMICL